MITCLRDWKLKEIRVYPRINCLSTTKRREGKRFEIGKQQEEEEYMFLQRNIYIYIYIERERERERERNGSDDSLRSKGKTICSSL